MDGLTKVLERFANWIDVAVRFFDGFGMLLMHIFVLALCYALFVFLVPNSFRAMLRWSTGLACVSYIADFFLKK